MRVVARAAEWGRGGVDAAGTVGPTCTQISLLTCCTTPATDATSSSPTVNVPCPLRTHNVKSIYPTHDAGKRCCDGLRLVVCTGDPSR